MKIPLRHYLSLLGITTAAFVFNTSEFMPIALLTDIAGSFSMTTAETGGMITIYAWVVAVLSLPLMLLTCRMELKRLMLLVVAVFSVGQLLSGIATSYPMLLAARIVVACAHAIFWSIAAPLAAQLVTHEHRPMALGMIVTGSSVAMIFGLPIGRMIGLYAGWRMTFLIIAGVALAALLYLAYMLPQRKQDKPFSAHDLPQLLRNPALSCIYVMTALFATAYFTAYSYIEPFLHEIASFSPTLITVALMAIGACGILASLLFTHGYGRHRFLLLRFVLPCVFAVLLLFQAASISMFTMLLLCMFVGMVATLYNILFQAELLGLVMGPGSTVAMSIYSGIFNIGIGSGTWIGSLAAGHGHLAHIGYIGAAIAAITVFFCWHIYLPTIQGKRY